VPSTYRSQIIQLFYLDVEFSVVLNSSNADDIVVTELFIIYNLFYKFI